MSWLKTWRERKRCWHHDVHTGETWTYSYLIDTGMRKLFACKQCGKVRIY